MQNMTRAQYLKMLVDSLMIVENGDDTPEEAAQDTVFKFRGNKSGGMSGTVSTKNVEDHLRAKGFINGKHFTWLDPYTLRIEPELVDRDLLNTIEAAGARTSQDTHESYKDDMQQRMGDHSNAWLQHLGVTREHAVNMGHVRAMEVLHPHVLQRLSPDVHRVVSDPDYKEMVAHVYRMHHNRHGEHEENVARIVGAMEKEFKPYTYYKGNR